MKSRVEGLLLLRTGIVRIVLELRAVWFSRMGRGYHSDRYLSIGMLLSSDLF